MKIAVISDTHFGYGHGTERVDDAFHLFEEALEKSKDCDIILLAGDIFDTKNPSNVVFSRVEQLLNKPLLLSSEAKLIEGHDKEIAQLSQLTTQGIPVVAINGNHDRKIKGTTNPVEALEKAGFIIHLHGNAVVFQKGEERVGVYGMSYVPDQYAPEVLKELHPKPIENTFSIFMLHQNLKGFVPAEYVIEPSALPQGFDLYICGHMHDMKESYAHQKPLLLPGSIIPTQLNQESQNPKGFFHIETASDKPVITFIPFEKQRKFFYLTLEEQATKEEAIKQIEELLKDDFSQKPMIKIKTKKMIYGLQKALKTMFEDSALFYFVKENLVDRPFQVVDIATHKLSVHEVGKSILLQNLKTEELNERLFEHVFELLLEGEKEKALTKILENH